MKQQKSDRTLLQSELKTVPKRQLDLKKSRTPSTRPANCQSNTMTHTPRDSKDFGTDRTIQESSIDLNSSRRMLTTSRSNQLSKSPNTQSNNNRSKKTILTVRNLQKITKKKSKAPTNPTDEQILTLRINEFTHQRSTIFDRALMKIKDDQQNIDSM